MITGSPDRPARSAGTFDIACDLIEDLVTGPARHEIVAAAARPSEARKSLARLRESLRSHEFMAGTRRISLASVIHACDRRTRQEGLHVLHDWDGKADHINAQIIPIEVLDFIAARRGDDATDPFVLAVLLDYYLLYVLGLIAMRSWDDGDPARNLTRLGTLLAHLQGPDGSGERFVSDAETLLLLATSHYEIDERGYDRLLARVRLLSGPHRLRIALGHAVSLGCHLRFGFEATYGRDVGRMRDDNAADYPWLCFALATVMDAYVGLVDAGLDGPQRERLVEALLNGLSADPKAMLGVPPTSLAACEAERRGFADAFAPHRAALLAAFERLEPTAGGYTPLAFFFNFSQNVVKGRVVDTLLRRQRWSPTLNDLLTSRGDDPPVSERQALATTLMTYARANPDTIRGRRMPVIVYDPLAGRRVHRTCLDALRGARP